jgi:hypothetical protein
VTWRAPVRSILIWERWELGLAAIWGRQVAGAGGGELNFGEVEEEKLGFSMTDQWVS